MDLRSAFRPMVALVVTTMALLASEPRAEQDAQPRTIVDGQFSLALPAGWSVYDQAAAVQGRPSPTGVIVFSAESLVTPGQSAADVAALARVDRGELPSFIVDRQKAERGMSCAKLSTTAIYNVGTKLNKDPVLSATRRHFAAMAPRHEDITLGGCRGARFLLEANKDDPAKHWIIDVRAISDGQVLYLFGLRNPAEQYRHNIGFFEAALVTLSFP